MRCPTDLDLDIEHGFSINIETQSNLHVMSKPLLVSLLHSCPVFPEVLVLDIIEKPLEFGEILEPHALLNVQGYGDEPAEPGVALVCVT